MSEVVREASSSADAGGAQGVAAAAAPAPGAIPAASVAQQPSTQQQQAVSQSTTDERTQTAGEDVQFKYHQQMLYPTPGLRNYGFSDEFMMYTFKVEPCRRQEKHARGSCPYAHPGDVAQRRHPESYQALLCPEVRAKKVCPRGSSCQCSHSAFEFWLHPDRYRTSICEKGERCSRPVCFFAHNDKELRQLPAGLKPAIQTPEETAKRQGNSRSSGTSSISQSPRDAASMQGPLPGPAFAREGLQYVYMPGLGLQPQGRPLVPRQPLPMVAAPAYPAYATAGYRGMQMPAPLDVNGQGQYSTMVGTQYLPGTRLLSPGATVQAQGVGGGAVLLGGPQAAAAAAAAPQFSSVAGMAGRSSHSSGGTSSLTGMWPAQQQQQQPQHPHARSAAPGAPAGGVQLPEDMLQQFQQFGVGGTAMQPGPQLAPSNAALLPAVASPGSGYAPQASPMYSPPASEQTWVQQPLQLQPSPHMAQATYSFAPYSPAMMAPQQHSAQVVAEQQRMPAGAMLGGVLTAQVGPPAMGPPAAQPAPAGAFAGMPGDAQGALGQPWGAGGVMLGPQDAGTLVGAAMGISSRPPSTTGPQPPYDHPGAW